MVQGLLNPQQQIPANPQEAPPGEPGGMSPDDQETIDKFLANGIKIVHDMKVSDGLIKSIVDAQNPVIAIADATVGVIDRLESSAANKGKGLSMGRLAQVANILMGEIIRIAETAGLAPLGKEERYQAFSLATSKYIDNAVKTKRMPQEKLVQMGEYAKQTPEGRKIVQEAGSAMAQGPQPGNMPPGNMGGM